MAMKISLTDAGKRFNREWIFRHLSYTFEKEYSYAITGPNGSGKSTLLQVLSGSMHYNEGAIHYLSNNSLLSPESVYRQVSICAPYLELVEEMSLEEFLAFHRNFKPFLVGLDSGIIMSRMGLEKAAGKQIRYFSSGMKQRVKLAQALFSDTKIVLLDEPCTNLDAAGIELYQQLIPEFGRDRLIIVSSNDEEEYRFCNKRISILDFK